MMKFKKNLKKSMKYIIFTGVNILTIIIKYILSARPNLYSNDTQYTNITATKQKTETPQTPADGGGVVSVRTENATGRRVPHTYVSRENAICYTVSAACVLCETTPLDTRPPDRGLYL